MILISLLVGCMPKNDNEHLYFTTNENELTLKIIPFETERTTFDLNDSISSTYNFIYVGKVKDQYLTEKLSKDEFYIQINDVISSPEAIPEFLDCSHCDFEKYKVIIVADKSTPEDFLKEIESKILYPYSGYKSSQIYYYEVNSSTRMSGYNRKNFYKNNSKSVSTFNVKFNNEKYLTFVKNLVEDSLSVNWLYINPVIIKTTFQIDTNSSIPILPINPPSILFFNFDKLEFLQKDFKSVQIINDKDIFKTDKTLRIDSLFKYKTEKFGRGLVVSLPYSYVHADVVFIDYQIFDWDFCGTGDYQSVFYTELNIIDK